MILANYTQPRAEPVSLLETKAHLRVTSTADDALISALITAARQWAEKYERQSYIMRKYKLYLDEFPSCINLPYGPVALVDSVQYYDSSGALQTLATSYYTVDKDSSPCRIYLAYNQSWPSTYDIPKAVVITYTAGYEMTFTADATSNVITCGDAVFASGDPVRVSTDSADLPSPLAIETDYYVRDVSGTTFKLALTLDGTAIDITDAGSGTHYIGFSNKGGIPARVKNAIKLITASLYENREETTELNLEHVPFAAKNLLMEREF
jgi:uncharacterized phiE125 gp8 family phage protein